MSKPKHHPVADLFPMLPDDELREMSEDIRARGQLQAIVLDSEGRILDGRNRQAACDLAEVEPVYETYGGDDPDGYALAVNIRRRHLTKGQQAMIAAKAGAVCGKPLSKVAEQTGTSKARVVYAKVVIDFAPELVDSVVAGATPLDKAYETAKQRKQDGAGDTAKLAQVREFSPDLADKVTDEELTLQAALTEVRERQAAQKRTRETAGNVAQTFLSRLQSDTSALIASRQQGDEPWINETVIKEARKALDLLEEQAL